MTTTRPKITTTHLILHRYYQQCAPGHQEKARLTAQSWHSNGTYCNDPTPSGQGHPLSWHVACVGHQRRYFTNKLLAHELTNYQHTALPRCWDQTKVGSHNYGECELCIFTCGRYPTACMVACMGGILHAWEVSCMHGTKDTYHACMILRIPAQLPCM